jgi:hypothetical protein
MSWSEGRRLLFGLAICVCFAPMLAAFGQPPRSGPAKKPDLRAQFGDVVGVDDKGKSEMPSKAKADQPVKKLPEPVKDVGVLLYDMPLTAPGAERLFRLDSEAVFRERLRTEVRAKYPKATLGFPDSDMPTIDPQPPRRWPAYTKFVEPHYVVSKRLFFEQTRFERYGESVGVLQPLVSTGVFGIDVLLYPARRIAPPFRCYQVNSDGYSPYFRIFGE